MAARTAVVCQRITGWLVRRAAADDGDDSAEEHERRQDHDRQEEDGLRLVRAHEDRGLLHVLGADRDLVFLLGQPAHGVEEEVAVALDVEELVRGNVGRAVHDHAGFVDRRDRRDGERPLQILCIGLGHAALEIRAVGLPPALCTGAREPLDVDALGRGLERGDRKSTRLNSSHITISYAVFCLKKKKKKNYKYKKQKKKKKK